MLGKEKQNRVLWPVLLPGTGKKAVCDTADIDRTEKYMIKRELVHTSEDFYCNGRSGTGPKSPIRHAATGQ